MLTEELFIRIELGLKKPILFYKKLNSGFVNDLYYITTEGKRYVVKIFNSYLKDNQILFSINIQTFLSEKNLSPNVILFSNNILPFFAIFEYVDNFEKYIDKEYYYQIGVLLGKIHENLYNSSIICSNIYEPIDILTYLKNTNKLSSCQENLLDIKLNLKNQINKNFFSMLPKQMIHGDFHKNNILISSNNYYAIDFDEAKVYYRIYDIIKVIILSIKEYGFMQAYNFISDFLLGYTKSITLFEEEIKYMLDMYIYTLSNDPSCFTPYSYVMDEEYIFKRINLHRFVLSQLSQIRSFINELNFKR